MSGMKLIGILLAVMFQIICLIYYFFDVGEIFLETTEVNHKIYQDKADESLKFNLTKSTPKIYFFEDGGGEDEAVVLFKSVLPEYRVEDLRKRFGNPQWKSWSRLRTFRGNELDVCIVTMGRDGGMFSKWIYYSYVGKLVYISGEDHDNDFPRLSRLPESYIIGPVPEETNKSLPVYYLQYVWWALFRPKYQDRALFDIQYKPNSTGEHFLIYACANCVTERERAFDKLSSIGNSHYGGKCNGLSKDFTNKTKLETGVSIYN